MKSVALFIIAIILALSEGGQCLPLKDESNVVSIVIDDQNMKPIILECDYSVNDTESFLTVKWFKGTEAIYQWIRGNQPSAYPDFTDDVDSSYEASDDPNYQYSSLALINPTIDAAGVYKCVVQTKSGAHTSSKRVQIIDVRNYTLNLFYHKIQNETHLECIVANVFPEPILDITADDDDVITTMTAETNKNDDGYYNSTKISTTYDDDEDPDAYKCTLYFEGHTLNLTTTATSGGQCLPLKDESNVVSIVIDDQNMKPIILECDYSVNDTESFLTVKWFKGTEAIYQWIRGNQPSAYPDFTDDVDSSYEASDDPNYQYSSLALINPTIDAAGVYKCVVQTKSGAHTSSKRVQIIDVRNYTLNLFYHKIQNETHLECIVANVFPEPILDITADDDDVITTMTAETNKNDDGYYNSTKISTTYDDDEDPDAYKCTLYFEGHTLNLTTTATSGSLALYNNIKLFWFLPSLYCLTKMLLSS